MIFEKDIKWPGKGLEYIMPPNTGQIITEPNEIKTHARDFYKEIMTEKESPPDLAALEAEWSNDYQPPDNIDENIYRDTIQEITMSELINQMK